MRGFLILWMALLCAARAFAESPIREGDRVAIVGNTFADQLRVHGYLEAMLVEHSNVSVRNLGWGGDMLTARDRPTNFPSEESTLTAHKTDVIIACFGMGESFAGTEGIFDFQKDLTAFIAAHDGKKYNGASEVRLVLVSPIACEDRGTLTPSLAKRNSELKAYTRAMEEVAGVALVSFVDLFEPSRYLMDESKDTNLTTNGIHLNAFGYWAISHAFFEQLSGDADPQWRMQIDAKTTEGSAIGVEISSVTAKGDGVSFSVAEKSAPSLAPQTDADLPLQLSSLRDRLQVNNLAPGDYTLTVDGDEVVTANHEAWARGVVIDSSPAHREAEAFRAAINDKNLQFTYSWKALNQVHIVGERRSSPSGRALPAEVAEFNKLAKQRDEKLKGGVKLKTRQWKLAPAKS